MFDLITSDIIKSWNIPQNRLFGKIKEYANNLYKEGKSLEEIKELVLEACKDKFNYKSINPISNKQVANYYEVINPSLTYPIDKSKIKEYSKLLKFNINKDIIVQPDFSITGAIPVGTTIVTDKDILVPYYTSADMFCSVSWSELEVNNDLDKKIELLKEVKCSTKDNNIDEDTILKFIKNDIELLPICIKDKVKELIDKSLLTIGDGNHFINICYNKETNKYYIVAHFGSRNYGAFIYKYFNNLALIRTRKELNNPKYNYIGWLDKNKDSKSFYEYETTLKVIKKLVEYFHYRIHLSIEKYVKHFNITYHNTIEFIDNFNYHCKGSIVTTEHNRSIAIPLGFGNPIVLVRQSGYPFKDNLVYSYPHGSGRTMSRIEYINNLKENIKIPDNIMFESGEPDLSELQGAYRDPKEILLYISKGSIEYLDIIYSKMAGKINHFSRNKTYK